MEMLGNVTVSVNLNLREPKKMSGRTNLYVVVKVDNMSAKLPIGVNVYSYAWNKKAQMVNVTPSMSEEERAYNIAQNAKIFEVKAKYMQIISYLCSASESMTSNEVFEYIKQEYSEYKNIEVMANSNPIPNRRKATASKLLKKAFERMYGTKENPQVAKGTFVNASGHLKSFLEWLSNNKVSVYDSVAYLKQSTLNEYKMYLEDVNREKGSGSANSIAHKVNLIVSIVNELRGWKECERYNIPMLNKLSQKSYKKNDNTKRIALKKEWLEKVFSNENLTEKEKFFRDIFKMQLESGTRFSDLYKLFVREYDVQEYDGKKCMVVNTQKEGITAVVIVTKEIEELQKKYADGMPYKLNEKSYNKALKSMFENSGVTNEYTYIEDFNGTERKVCARVCDVITNHFARHTFITEKANEGWSFDKLSYCTGHADDAMIRKVYAHLGDNYKVQSVVKESKRVERTKNAEVNESTSSVNELIEKGKSIKEDELLKECKEVLVFLGEKYEDIADIKDIDTLNIMIYVDHHHKLESIGVSTKVVKELYNNANVTLKEKKEALKQVVEKALLKMAESE